MALEMGNSDLIGLLCFFFAIFCGLWAQETKRNYWLWFIAGFLFAPVTGIVLMVKNAGHHPKP
jgi:hypothetical protein